MLVVMLLLLLVVMLMSLVLPHFKKMDCVDKISNDVSLKNLLRKILEDSQVESLNAFNSTDHPLAIT